MVSACPEESTCCWRSRGACWGPGVRERGCVGSCRCCAGGRRRSRCGCPGSRRTHAHAPKQGCKGVRLVRSRRCLLSSVHEWLLQQMQPLSMHATTFYASPWAVRAKPKEQAWTPSSRKDSAEGSWLVPQGSLDLQLLLIVNCQEGAKCSDCLRRLPSSGGVIASHT